MKECIVSNGKRKIKWTGTVKDFVCIFEFIKSNNLAVFSDKDLLDTFELGDRTTPAALRTMRSKIYHDPDYKPGEMVMQFEAFFTRKKLAETSKSFKKLQKMFFKTTSD